MHLRVMHRGGSYDLAPMNRESIDFLFDYIESLEYKLAQGIRVGEPKPVVSLAELDPYYMARAVAQFGYPATE